MWFLFQRLIAVLLSLLLFDAFQDCRSLGEIWHTFRTMPHIAQIGTIAIVLVVVCVVWESLAFVYRYAKPVIRRTVAHLFPILNRWLQARKNSSQLKLPDHSSPALQADIPPTPAVLDTQSKPRDQPAK